MGLLDDFNSLSDNAKQYALNAIARFGNGVGNTVNAIPTNAQNLARGLLDLPQRASTELTGLLNQQLNNQVQQTYQPTLSDLLINPRPKANPQQWMDQGMMLAGLAPLSGMAGVIKEVGKMPKNSIYPNGITSDMVSVGIPEMFGTGMSGTIKKMTNGDYLGRYNPAWGAEGKPFYAIGDNPEELKSFMLSKMLKSEAGTASAKTAKYNKSLIGVLNNEFGEGAFSKAGRSSQSSSEYYQHVPSGTKIRIADHDLPLHYEQPDIDLRSWMSTDEKIQAIKKYLGLE